ncbi:MAG TPA: cytochrome b N-terminal domain-containing protein [Bryobacteraceae bacterium]
MDKLRKTAVWLDDRLHLTALYASTAGHEVPKSSGSWFYVLGSGTLLCFVIQVLTGICLAFVYVPSTNEAWTTLNYLNHHQFLGWYMRAIHEWGANFMVAIMTLHMIQVFLFGAYKYPRELTWISGTFLLFITLGLSFTGEVMRFDQNAYWGLGIGVEIMGRVPGIGGGLVHLLLAGPIIAGETLSRFFTLHVFILPGLFIAIIAMHLRLVLNKGISEVPKVGRPVHKATYDAHYADILRKEGVPFVPYAIGKDLIFAAIVIIGILGCALIFGPSGPVGPPNPTVIQASPTPDFYFLWIFAGLALLPDWMETFVMFGAPLIIFVVMVLLPFWSGSGEKHVRRRPIAVLVVIFCVMVFGILTYEGATTPWSPHMEAWSSNPTPAKYLVGRTPLEMRGAAVFENKQCRNCHSLGGVGGVRGPALDTVGQRLTRPQLVRQVIQGGGNMPAFGKELSPAEVDAVVSFMQTLRSKGAPPAHNSTVPQNNLLRDVASNRMPRPPLRQ